MTTLDPQAALGAATDCCVQIEPSEVGLTIVDPIQRCRDALALKPAAATPMPVDPDTLTAPVTAAVEVEVSEILLNRIPLVYVWDDDWSSLAHIEENANRTFRDGRFILFVSGPIKLYIEVDGSVTVTGSDETQLSFARETSVRIGARSSHERPAGVVTTTTDPEDLMAAVSTFGSGLKATSPERSWPSMRGHPPSIDVGDSLDVPPGLHSPDTGVWIEVPRTLRHVYVVSPLAYYLGATVVPGSEPRIVTDEGFSTPLEGPDGFETAAERALKQVLFLECLARDEGIYELPLTERKAVESALDTDFGRLYGLSPATRLRSMLSVPYRRIAEHVPNWELCTYVDPDPDWIPVVPHLVDDLAVIKTTDSLHVESMPESAAAEAVLETQTAAATTFFRGSDGGGTATAGDGGAVSVPDGSFLEQSWAGSGCPVGASKTVMDAYQNQLEREPTDGPIQVAVVCNDQRMRDEVAGIDNYGVEGTHVDFEFDVTVYDDLSTGALATLLEHQEIDFFHYIGHAEPAGIECRDGLLDIGSLGSVALDSFLLNACDSYEQGKALIKNGAVGGFVTINEVPNDLAFEVGRFLARLLNAGFTLRSSINIVRDEYLLGDRYIIVGDGGASVSAHYRIGTPAYKVQRDGDEVLVDILLYGSHEGRIGSVARPHIDSADYQLIGNRSQSYRMEKDEVVELFDDVNLPIHIFGGWQWSHDVSFDDL